MLPLEIVYAFDPIPPPPPEYLTLADTLQPTADGFAPLHVHVSDGGSAQITLLSCAALPQLLHSFFTVCW